MNLYYKKILYELDNKLYTDCLNTIGENKKSIISDNISELLLDYIRVFCLMKNRKYKATSLLINELIEKNTYKIINNLNNNISKEFIGMQILNFVFILLIVNKNYNYINTESSDINKIYSLINYVKKIKNIPRLKNIIILYKEYISIFESYLEKNQIPPDTLILNNSLSFCFKLYEDKLIDHLKVLLIDRNEE